MVGPYFTKLRRDATIWHSVIASRDGWRTHCGHQLGRAATRRLVGDGASPTPLCYLCCEARERLIAQAAASRGTR